jgi:hypothetical protein
MSVCIATSIFIFGIYARVGTFGLCQVKQWLSAYHPPTKITSVPTRASLQQNISTNGSAESMILNGTTIRLSKCDSSFNYYYYYYYCN